MPSAAAFRTTAPETSQIQHQTQPETAPKLVVFSNRPPTNPISGGAALGIKEASKVLNDEILWVALAEGGKDVTKPFVTPSVVDGINVLTVTIPREQYDKHYNGLCNGSLWPLLHGMLDNAHAVKNPGGISADLRGHIQTLRMVFETVRPELATYGVTDETKVWLHDYHFMLGAWMMKKLGYKNPTEFFLHIPVMAKQTYDQLEGQAKRLMEMFFGGLECMNSVAFQTQADARNYHEILAGDEPPPSLGIDMFESTTRRKTTRDGTQTIGVMPISIDTEYAKKVAEEHVPSDEIGALQARLTAKHIILGAERCDPTKGILARLAGFDLLLTRYPHRCGQAQLMVIAEPSRQGVKEYQKYKAAVEKKVREINEKYKESYDGIEPIVLLEKGLQREDLLWSMSQNNWPLASLGKVGTFLAYAFGKAAIAPQKIHIIVNSIADGMNLVAKEAFAVQNIFNSARMILSRTIGAAKELGDYATLCDPAPESICEAMEESMQLSQEEVNMRCWKAQAHMAWASVEKWVHSTLKMFGMEIGDEKPEAGPGTSLRVPANDTERKPKVV